MKRIICFLLSLILLTPILSVSASSGDTKVYGCVSNDEMKIALTFDDGPHPKRTGEILDVLGEYGIKATFFQVGENVILYSDAAKRVVAEGHEIGNHTYTHPHIKNLNEDQLSEETKKCENAIIDVTGVHPKLFRPPEGVVDAAVKTWASKSGYSVVLWSVDTKDWAGTSSEDMVLKVQNKIKSGDIILMHDYSSKRCHTVEALKKMIPMLIDKGYEFVTVSELLGL